MKLDVHHAACRLRTDDEQAALSGPGRREVPDTPTPGRSAHNGDLGVASGRLGAEPTTPAEPDNEETR